MSCTYGISVQCSLAIYGLVRVLLSNCASVNMMSLDLLALQGLSLTMDRIHILAYYTRSDHVHATYACPSIIHPHQYDMSFQQFYLRNTTVIILYTSSPSPCNFSMQALGAYYARMFDLSFEGNTLICVLIVIATNLSDDDQLSRIMTLS
jgi:hypothetical protein